jgi:hypothetical protein
LITGRQALILPCLGRTEIDEQASGAAIFDNRKLDGGGRRVAGSFAPRSDQLLSEPAMVAGLAKAVLANRSSVDWDNLVADYGRIREHIERVVPDFEDYNERMRQPVVFICPIQFVNVNSKRKMDARISPSILCRTLSCKKSSS